MPGLGPAEVSQATLFHGGPAHDRGAPVHHHGHLARFGFRVSAGKGRWRGRFVGKPKTLAKGFNRKPKGKPQLDVICLVQYVDMSEKEGVRKSSCCRDNHVCERL